MSELSSFQCPEEERFIDIDNDVQYVRPWYQQVMREKAEADEWDSY